MLHQIGRNQRDPFGITHQRFQGRPFRFELLLLRLFFALCDFFKLGVQLG